MEIARGAEAVLTKTPKGIVKRRLKKTYRHPDLDEQLRTTRTKAEARILEKARRAGVPVPNVEEVDTYTLLLEEIPGIVLKDVLDEHPTLTEQVGEHVAKLHDAHIIHGDLTTSNMIQNGSTIYLIDFGLAFHSRRVEDKAVDLHVLKQALASRHHTVSDKAYAAFLNGYVPEEKEQILTRLAHVEKRGRNKK